MEQDLDLERRKILDLIVRQPGLHLSKIAELLEMKITSVQRSLDHFENEGIIFSVNKAGVKQYFFDKRSVKPRDMRTFETREKIRDLIAQNPGLHLSKIAEMLDMSISLTDYHLLYLEKNPSRLLLHKN